MNDCAYRGMCTNKNEYGIYSYLQFFRVEGPLLQLGWKRTTDKYDERFRLKWVECKSKINYGAFREGKLLEHCPHDTHRDFFSF